MRQVFLFPILLLSLVANVLFVLSLIPINLGGGIELSDSTVGCVARISILEEQNFLREEAGKGKLRIEVESITDSRTTALEIKMEPNRLDNLYKFRDDAGAVMWNEGRLTVRPNHQWRIEFDPHATKD